MARPRIGTVVLPKQTPVWRGHVLCVMSDHDFNFRVSTVVEIMRDRLTREGYLFSQVSTLRDRDWKMDFTALDYSLCRSIDFVVLIFGNEEIERHLSSAGIPYAVVGGTWQDRPDCVGRIVCSTRRAVADFAEHCRAAQVRNVSLVYCNHKYPTAVAVEEALSAAGMAVTDIRISADVGDSRLQNVACAGAKAARRIMRPTKGRVAPDLIFVADDFLAIGMLDSAVRLGVRIPEDVRFVCMVNEGDRPYFTKSLACISFDAAACGRMVANILVEHLKLGRPIPSRAFQSTYQKGATFP